MPDEQIKVHADGFSVASFSFIELELSLLYTERMQAASLWSDPFRCLLFPVPMFSVYLLHVRQPLIPPII